jgi:hypothetical protein
MKPAGSPKASIYQSVYFQNSDDCSLFLSVFLYVEVLLQYTTSFSACSICKWKDLQHDLIHIWI